MRRRIIVQSELELYYNRAMTANGMAAQCIHLNCLIMRKCCLTCSCLLATSFTQPSLLLQRRLAHGLPSNLLGLTNDLVGEFRMPFWEVTLSANGDTTLWGFDIGTLGFQSILASIQTRLISCVLTSSHNSASIRSGAELPLVFSSPNFIVVRYGSIIIGRRVFCAASSWEDFGLSVDVMRRGWLLGESGVVYSIGEVCCIGRRHDDENS